MADAKYQDGSITLEFYARICRFAIVTESNGNKKLIILFASEVITSVKDSPDLTKKHVPCEKCEFDYAINKTIVAWHQSLSAVFRSHVKKVNEAKIRNSKYFEV